MVIRVMHTVFVDRDGVLNEQRDDYVKDTTELRVLPSVPEAVARLCAAGCRIVVVSNQQGVAKGLMTEASLREMESSISADLACAGGSIRAYYYCTHLAGSGCHCRKPSPGMLLQAARDLDLDLSTCVLIGDSDSDITAGRAVGCTTVLVCSGIRSEDYYRSASRLADYTARDLGEAADMVIQHFAHIDAGSS